MIVDPSTTKYLIKASIKADGVIEKPDVVGAIFGQTEGLLGNELDLRDLQKSARIGRIEVDIDAKKGKSEGEILLPSSMDKVETAILGAALESIDRVGPCKAKIEVTSIEDVRVSRRKQVIDRAKALLQGLLDESKTESADLTGEVRTAVQVAEIVKFGQEKLPAGPNVHNADAIILVEGRNDVLNLLKHGIKNAVAVEGTNIPKSIQEKTKECVTTAFVDGDRGGELILRELLQTCEVDFVARAPQTREVEEIPQKLIMKALKNKIPAEQYAEMYNIPFKKGAGGGKKTPSGRVSAEGLDALAGPEETGSGPPQKTGNGAPKEKPQERPPAQKQQEKPAPKTQEKPQEKPQDHGGSSKGGGSQKELSKDQSVYLKTLDELKGSLKAVLLDKDGKEVQKGVAVRDLAETLKNAKKEVDAVVFDGVVTQRLLDIAADKKIGTVVGAKIGNVNKRPDKVEVFAREDLS